MRYRIGYKYNGKGARNKASIVYVSNPTYVVELEASTHAEAARLLQRTILPNDPRDICGRSNVSMFAVRS